MSGIGGVGFMTIQMAGKEPVVIDYFGRAPGAATADMYEITSDERSVVGFGGVKDQANAYGPLSCAVPGMVAGLAYAVEHYGTKDLAEVVGPAAQLAEEGFEVNWYNGMLLSSQQKTIQRDPETARIFLNNGAPPAPLFGQPNPAHPPAGTGRNAAEDRSPGQGWLLQGRSRREDRQPPPVARRHHDGRRPGAIRADRRQADRHPLPGLRAGPAAVPGRRNHAGRDVQHPRRLQHPLHRPQHGPDAACHRRGEQARLCRPLRVCWRSGLCRYRLGSAGLEGIR